MEAVKTQQIIKKRIIGRPFRKGNPGGPGRPALTESQKIVNKAVRDVIGEYRESLTEVLPDLSPVLKAKALEGDMQAIREIHEVIELKKNPDSPLAGDIKQLVLIINNVLNAKS